MGIVMEMRVKVLVRCWFDEGVATALNEIELKDCACVVWVQSESGARERWRIAAIRPVNVIYALVDRRVVRRSLLILL